jgi:hypothetical protein
MRTRQWQKRGEGPALVSQSLLGGLVSIPPACSCLCSCRGLPRCRCPLGRISRESYASLDLRTVSKWVYRHQHMSNICLRPDQHCVPLSTNPAMAGLTQRLRTYISAFSKRFLRFSLMASLEILLISVRSETPTSFFRVVSKTAFFANCAFCPPPAAGLEEPASFLRPARFVTACRTERCQPPNPGC